MFDSCRFLRQEVSLDPERNGEVKNGVTSCFAPVTGSASIFLPVIDLFAPFSHFKLPNFVGHLEKALSCENGANRSITSRKMVALPVWRANQEVTAFWASP